MLGSEVNALICAFNRLYVSMCRYSSTEINIFPGDCEKLDIEPYEVGRLFSYIIDCEPDICKRLFTIINDDWRRMCNRWWLCMCAYYHPDNIRRAICESKLFDTWIWDIGGVKRISLKDDKYKPDFCQIEYKRDRLKQIIQDIDELKYWSNNHVWQSTQPEKPQDKQLAQQTVPRYAIQSELLPILERGRKAGFLDDEYKPIPKSMTRPQQKRFALLACIEAGLDNYCSRFGQMWGCDYNGVDESRGAAQRREAIDSLFVRDIIDKAKLK